MVVEPGMVGSQRQVGKAFLDYTAKLHKEKGGRDLVGKELLQLNNNPVFTLLRVL